MKKTTKRNRKKANGVKSSEASNAVRRAKRKANKARRREMKNLVFWLGSEQSGHEFRALQRLQQYNGKLDWALSALQKIAARNEKYLYTNPQLYPYSINHARLDPAPAIARLLIKKITGPAYSALTEGL